MTGFRGSETSSKGEVFWDADNADHRRAFATAMAPIVSVLWKKSESFGPVEARTYMRTLKHVPSAILVAVVEKSLAEDKWFPEPTVLLDYAAQLIDTQRREVRIKWIQHCDHAGGFEEIEIEGVVKLKRCACRERMALELASIGAPIERPKPKLIMAQSGEEIA